MSARVGGIKQVTLGLNGVPDYQGTIAATTAGVDNGNTGTPFTLPQGPGGGIGIYLEADADVFISIQLRSGITPPATTQAMKITGGSGLFLILKEDRNVILARTATSTANVKVFKIS